MRGRNVYFEMRSRKLLVYFREFWLVKYPLLFPCQGALTTLLSPHKCSTDHVVAFVTNCIWLDLTCDHAGKLTIQEITTKRSQERLQYFSLAEQSY